MKKQNKGFTIVELVIVIAVIAVLAAVLIPTFSSLIKKANLSADKAAVRDMNTALAADQALHGKPADVETTMQVLANAGFNTVNWKPITKGYEVYWYKEANKMILYNAAAASVEYPDEFAITWKEGSRTVNIFTATTAKGSKLEKYGATITTQVYNQNFKDAIEADISLDSNSATGGVTIDDITSGSSSGGSGATMTSSDKDNLAELGTALTVDSDIKSVLNLASNSEVYVNAQKFEKSTNDENATTYASMSIMSVGDTQVDYQSSGAEIVNNLYYISVVEAPNATASQVSAAQSAAGKYVYTLFTQINENKIDNGAAIVLKSGTTIDVSGNEWAPAKRFSGYFGTTDAANPIVVSGARLTSATSYSATVTFDGSNGKYFVTGFFGTLYGNTTVENVRFENMEIDQPASDFNMADTKMTVSRNSVSIFGGVIDGYYDKNNNFVQVPANVTLRNVNVTNTVSITGAATAAGLVAYVGGSGNENAVFNGNVLFDNCHISAKVLGKLAVAGNNGYGPCGGILGFACRSRENTYALGKDSDSDSVEMINIIIKDCTFDGSVDGYKDVGACIGNIINGNLVLVGNNDFSGATLNAKGLSSSLDTTPTANTVGSVCGNVEAQGNLIFVDEAQVVEGLPVYKGSDTQTSKINLTPKYDIVVDGVTIAAGMGTNNGTK